MNAPNPLENWIQARRNPQVPEGFADRVMDQVRAADMEGRPVQAAGQRPVWARAAWRLATAASLVLAFVGGLIGAATAVCVILTIAERGF